MCSSDLRWALGWLAVVSLITNGRAIHARLMLTSGPVDERRVEQYLLAWFFAAGVTRSWPVIVAFENASANLHYLVTMVMIGLAAGGVGTAAGFVSTYLAWTSPVGLSLVMVWIAKGTSESIWIAALIALMFTLLTLYVRDFGRMLAKVIAQREQLREQRDISDRERRRAEAERLRAEEERRRAENEQAVARAERERADAERERAERAVEARSRFFSTASHDLRQPLGALRSYGEAAAVHAQRLGHEPLQAIAAGIGRALDRAGPLVARYLDIAKLDSSSMQLHLRHCDVSRVLEDVRQSFAAEALQRGLDLQIRLPTELQPLAVYADETLLRGILDNLTGNALKFTPAGTVTLQAERHWGPQSELVRLLVSDTGIGIGDKDKALIFEDFYQVANRGRTGDHGVGLGLGIARRQAALLGAELRARDNTGPGCTFYFYLPLSKDTLAAVELPPLAVCLERSLSVLVVDDEVEVQASLCSMLEAVGVSVVTVSGHGEALERLQDGFRPDALIADYRLDGEMDGVRMLEALEDAGFRIPAVLLTGDTSAEHLARLAQAGRPVLHKPVSGRRLLSTLRDLAQPQPLDVAQGANHETRQ